MGTVMINPPPLTLSPLDGSNTESINWNSSLKIDPQYITEVRSCIERNFPQRRSEWGPSPYPANHLKQGVTLNPQGIYYEKEIGLLYNPYSFRLHHSLHALDQLFDRDNISSRFDSYISPFKLKEETANEQHLNFLREYHLLYVDLLEAINDSSAAVSRIKDKLDTHTMYKNAGIDAKHLRNRNGCDNTSLHFRQSCLANLVIDVLRSPENTIPTSARPHVLELLYCFDLESITSSFATYALGYTLPYRASDEPVEDLIPRSFMRTPEEKGGTLHNDLFLQNVKVQEIFKIQPGYGSVSKRMDFDAGVSRLLQHHPAETVQILLSLMRLPFTAVGNATRKLVFHTLVGLSKLDPIQKGNLFGIKASYRVNSEDGELSGLQSRVGATTGVGAGFGDGLDSLSREQLMARLRQTNNWVHLLEENIAARAANASAAPAFPAPFTDPKGYFRVLGLDHTISREEDFDLLLNACYRTLARKLHPDRTGGDKEAFQKIQAAYETLQDSRKREEYLKS
ncbi:hypothetical protein ACLOAV_006991 [Pseudogymnoascus australis]